MPVIEVSNDADAFSTRRRTKLRVTMFGFSILYLFVLFAALLEERGIGA